MKIYSVYLSEDGLMSQVYTNIKALYNGILEHGYEAKTIMIRSRETNESAHYGGRFTEVKFTYANLVKGLRESSDGGKLYERLTIICKGGDMRIYEHEIVSK